MMKVWVKSILLVITLSVYIALGSLAFVLIERDSSVAGQRVLRAQVKRFIANHSECVDAEAMRSLWQDIQTVWSRSVLHLPVKAGGPWRDTWRIQNAYVFCYTVVTTMGFGWITPSTLWGRIFCVVFAIPGIALNGYMLSVIGSTCQVVWIKCFNLFVRGTSSVKSQRVRNILGVLVTFMILWVVLIMIPAAIFVPLENWSLLTAQYFNFVALSTVGFGDIAPSHAALPPQYRTETGEYLYRVGVMLYFLISMAVFSTVFTGVWRYHKQRMFKAVGSGSSRLMMMIRGQSRLSREGVGHHNEAVELEDEAVELEDQAGECEDEAVKIESVSVELEDEAVACEVEVVERKDEAVELEDEAVELENQAGEREDEAVKIEGVAVELEDMAVECEVEVVERKDEAVERKDQAGERKGEAVELDDQAGEREVEVFERKDEVVELEDQAVELEDEAVERKDQAGERKDEAVERKDQAGEREVEAVELEDQAGEREVEVVERKDEAVELEDEAVERKDQAGERKGEAVELDDQAGEHEVEVVERKDEAVELEDQAKEREVEVVERKDEAVELEDQAGKRKDEAVEHKDEAVELEHEAVELED
ncbi:potassium channel subfamily K member 1-like [Patiria miniata]|uniref:Potassium channel domain-containing protein n=1 Tax=Patiria miniata TaxID=46514 RepID=A0A914ASB8_PATMI|nr:potassium channel subfamily K member 1-like [Patiria miniata]